MKGSSSFGTSLPRTGRVKDLIDEAASRSLYQNEFIAHRIGVIMKEKGITSEELAGKCLEIPRNELSLIVQGKPTGPIRLEWKRQIAEGLGLHANRGKTENMTEDGVDALFLPKSPWQKEMTLDDSDENRT